MNCFYLIMNEQDTNFYAVGIEVCRDCIFVLKCVDVLLRSSMEHYECFFLTSYITVNEVSQGYLLAVVFHMCTKAPSEVMTLHWTKDIVCLYFHVSG